jgi:hypothetical protein
MAQKVVYQQSRRQNHLREQVYAGGPIFTDVSSNIHLRLRCRDSRCDDPLHYEQATQARRSGPTGWLQTSGRRAPERRSSKLPGGGLASVSSERPRRLAGEHLAGTRNLSSFIGGSSARAEPCGHPTSAEPANSLISGELVLLGEYASNR